MIAQGVQLRGKGTDCGERRVLVALLRDQLAAHFGGREAGIEPVRFELGIGLTLAVHDLLQVRQELGQVFFRALAAPTGRIVQAGDAGSEFVAALAEGPPVPAEFPLGAALTAGSEFLDGTGAEEPSGAAPQRAVSGEEEIFERGSEFHRGRKSHGTGVESFLLRNHAVRFHQPPGMG